MPQIVVFSSIEIRQWPSATPCSSLRTFDKLHPQNLTNYTPKTWQITPPKLDKLHPQNLTENDSFPKGSKSSTRGQSIQVSFLVFLGVHFFFPKKKKRGHLKAKSTLNQLTENSQTQPNPTPTPTKPNPNQLFNQPTQPKPTNPPNSAPGSIHWRFVHCTTSMALSGPSTLDFFSCRVGRPPKKVDPSRVKKFHHRNWILGGPSQDL